MLAKSVACLAIIGSAAAYVPPMMSISANRREAISGAAAAAVAAPLLRSTAAHAEGKVENNFPKAPVITIIDHRGCPRYGKEYKGEKSGLAEDDQNCVKVAFSEVAVSDKTANDVLAQTLGALKK